MFAYKNMHIYIHKMLLFEIHICIEARILNEMNIQYICREYTSLEECDSRTCIIFQYV